MTRDYVAILVTRETLCAAIRDTLARIAEHRCADGQAIEWRCDPLPGKLLSFQLHVSWPCDGDE